MNDFYLVTYTLTIENEGEIQEIEAHSFVPKSEENTSEHLFNYYSVVNDMAKKEKVCEKVVINLDSIKIYEMTEV